MTAYKLIHVDLDDPNSYDPAGLPGAGDSVDGNAVSGHGSLSVDSVTDFDLTFGSLTANSATDLTLGNPSDAGGAATAMINGDVEHNATVWANGKLTAATIDGVIQLHGGTITLSGGLAVAGDGSETEVSLDGGTLGVAGTLSTTGTDSIIAVDNKATLNANALTFGGGESALSVTNASQVNIASAGTLAIGDDDSVDVDSGGTLKAVGLAAQITGSAIGAAGSFSVGGSNQKASAQIASADVSGFGELDVNGGLLTVAGDIDIGTAADGGTAEIFSSSGGLGKLSADTITVGNATGSVDACGNWSFTGTSGTFSVGTGGYATVKKTLWLNDVTAFTLGLTTGGSLEVGGDHGAVANRLEIDKGGTISGHGAIVAGSIVNDGLIEAAVGRLDLTGAFSKSSSGAVQVDNKATVDLHSAFYGTLKFQGGYQTTAILDSAKQYQSAAGGIAFTGKIGGLDNGDTLDLAPNTWGGLANKAIAHTELKGSSLLVRLSNNKVVTYHLTDALKGSVVDIRTLPDHHAGLTVEAESTQIKTGISGHPTHNTYLDSLISGWAAWKPDAGPITYCFSGAGDIQDAEQTHGETDIVQCDNPQVLTWNDGEESAFRSATDAFAAVCGLTFQETDSASSANLNIWLVPAIPSGDDDNGVVVGQSDNPAEDPSGHLWIYLLPWNDQSLDFGGTGEETMIHELGHAVGLAHPTDGGAEPDANAFPGASDGSTGINGQNQTIYTVMSYNHGSNLGPPTDSTFGDQGGLGAFDIAALQKLYGANEDYHTGNDVYQLPSTNEPGTGWMSIWDAGGIDTISNANSDVDAIIDLRAAPLTGPNAGGYLSYGDVIAGGFTIAHGVVIENAIGGNGGDNITGNSAANTLDGGAGNDVLTGGGGADTLIGGTGADTFVFDLASDSKGANYDIIQDFSGTGGDGDVIDLSAIDAKTGPGNQVFTFIGTEKFHHKAGELHYLVKDGFVLVQGDTNGDGKADFQIEVQNSNHDLASLAVSDFML